MAASNRVPLTSTPTKTVRTSPGPSQPDPEDDWLDNEAQAAAPAFAASPRASSTSDDDSSRHRRENETHQLAQLNNRLAGYIDRVSTLRVENQRLRETVRRVEEKKTVEASSTKIDFQKQIDALRQLANDEAMLRATAEAETQNLVKRLARATLLHAGLKEDFDRAIQRVNTLEAENAELRSKHRSITIQNLQKEKDVVEARKSLHELEETLKSLTVDNATLKKNIENLTAENRFLVKNHKRQIEEARRATEHELLEADSKAHDDSYLQSKIEEIRRVYEIKKEALKRRYNEETERMFSAYVPSEVHEQVKTQSTMLANRVAELQSEINDKKLLLDQERSWALAQLQHKDDIIKNTLVEHANLKKEFDNLLDIKESLQKELDTYRVLLEQEENRLNISSAGSSGRFSLSSSSSIAASSPPLNSCKRRRLPSGFESVWNSDDRDLEVVSECFGPVKIVDHDTKRGKFVVIENATDDELPLGKWCIIQQSGDLKVDHRFPLEFTVKAKAKLTLWSADLREKHSPPTDYVLRKTVFPWSGPDDVQLSTTIFDSNGVKMATRVSRLRPPAPGFAHKSQHIFGDDSIMECDSDPFDNSSCSIV